MDLEFSREMSMDSETEYTTSTSSGYSPPPASSSPAPQSPYPLPPPPPIPAKAKIILLNSNSHATLRREFGNENSKKQQELGRNDGLPLPSASNILRSSEPVGGIFPFPAPKDGYLPDANSETEPAAFPKVFPPKLISEEDQKQAFANTYKSPYQRSLIKPHRRLRNPPPQPVLGSLTRSIVHRKKLSDEVIVAEITFTDDPSTDSYEEFLGRVVESAGMTDNIEMVLGMLVVDWDNGSSLRDAGVRTGKQGLVTRIGSEQNWRDAVRTMRHHNWLNQGWTAWWWEDKGPQPVGLYF
jgi:hypothetical protein